MESPYFDDAHADVTDTRVLYKKQSLLANMLKMKTNAFDMKKLKESNFGTDKPKNDPKEAKVPDLRAERKRLSIQVRPADVK